MTLKCKLSMHNNVVTAHCSACIKKVLTYTQLEKQHILVHAQHVYTIFWRMLSIHNKNNPSTHHDRGCSTKDTVDRHVQ
jgi:hypothetical protein